MRSFLPHLCINIGLPSLNFHRWNIAAHPADWKHWWRWVSSSLQPVSLLVWSNERKKMTIHLVLGGINANRLCYLRPVQTKVARLINKILAKPGYGSARLLHAIVQKWMYSPTESTRRFIFAEVGLPETTASVGGLQKPLRQWLSQYFYNLLDDVRGDNIIFCRIGKGRRSEWIRDNRVIYFCCRKVQEYIWIKRVWRNTQLLFSLYKLPGLVCSFRILAEYPHLP